MSVKEVTLYYRDGSSDKVYQTQIEKKLDGYVVNFQYGRRGSTLQTGTKTKTPVDLNKAEEIWGKLVSEKTMKGYTLGEDGIPYAGTELAGEQFGYNPQLLNPIELEQVFKLIADDDYFAMEKKDGVRLFVKRTDGTIQGGNRKGLCVMVSLPISNAVMGLHTKLTADFVLDGEGMGDVYWPFDLLVYGGQSTTNMDAERRLSLMNALLDTAASPAIGRVSTAFTARQKEALFYKIRDEKGEGIVFKKRNSKYVAGKPASGGNQLKYKFKGSATCVVIKQNTGKRSVEVGVSDDAGLCVSVGNVTIPANFEVPAAFALIEVEYLYAFPGGSLFQPQYKGPRPDKDRIDLYNTLKFKQGTTDEDDEA